MPSLRREFCGLHAEPRCKPDARRRQELSPHVEIGIGILQNGVAMLFTMALSLFEGKDLDPGIPCRELTCACDCFRRRAIADDTEPETRLALGEYALDGKGKQCRQAIHRLSACLSPPA